MILFILGVAIVVVVLMMLYKKKLATGRGPATDSSPELEHELQKLLAFLETCNMKELVEKMESKDLYSNLLIEKNKTQSSSTDYVSWYAYRRSDSLDSVQNKKELLAILETSDMYHLRGHTYRCLAFLCTNTNDRELFNFLMQEVENETDDENLLPMLFGLEKMKKDLDFNIEPLKKLAVEGTEDVSHAAIKALSNCSHPEVESFLLNEFGVANKHMKALICRPLGTVGTTASIAVLRETHKKTRDSSLRWAIDEAITLINERENPGTTINPDATPVYIAGQKERDTSAMTDQLVPDSPVAFGYKCLWLAVKTTDNVRLGELLGLKEIKACNWSVGINRACEYGSDNRSVYITPSIGPWTLAVGWGLPSGDSPEQIKKVKQILETLSGEFGEAQFFASQRVSEFHTWMQASDGNITRAYGAVSTEGVNTIVEGEPTEFEKSIRLADTLSDEARDEAYFRQKDMVWPDEELVMEVAQHWSVDPTALEERDDIGPGLGLLGRL